MTPLKVRELGRGEIEACRELPVRVLQPDGADVLLWPVGGHVLRVELRASPDSGDSHRDSEWQAIRAGDVVFVRRAEGQVLRIDL